MVSYFFVLPDFIRRLAYEMLFIERNDKSRPPSSLGTVVYGFKVRQLCEMDLALGALHVALLEKFYAYKIAADSL
ncbi:hypothetical protein RRG08_063376 [Elysia crispata]|uniref:Uncharacterized protein n=1 Tax=Elysia crispata TaxID=231223 RepID=A0AAE1B296_9GAST|nr:hypothetical protein RRG08_063376 [Elysia crispata]